MDREEWQREDGLIPHRSMAAWMRSLDENGERKSGEDGSMRLRKRMGGLTNGRLMQMIDSLLPRLSVLG